MAKLEQILCFLEESFDPSGFPDYDHALNGLQVGGTDEVSHLAAAVDASERTVAAAVKSGVDFLLVHHGLFWGGLRPLTGPMLRKVRTLLNGGINLYSLHLPLDAHEEFGNNVLLMRALGLEPRERFGSFAGMDVGWWGAADLGREELLGRLKAATDDGARLIPAGPENIQRVGVLTGAGASALEEAAARGLDALITGEAPHHAYHAAMELGVNLFLGGHYATETFGVNAVVSGLSRKFGLSWEFLDFPTGL